MDKESVRNHYKRYRKSGLKALLSHETGGSEVALNLEQRNRVISAKSKRKTPMPGGLALFVTMPVITTPSL